MTIEIQSVEEFAEYVWDGARLYPEVEEAVRKRDAAIAAMYRERIAALEKLYADLEQHVATRDAGSQPEQLAAS